MLISRFEKILRNSGWLLCDRVFRAGIVFVMNIWVARHLGPDRFGLLCYGMSIVSLFLAVANLGLYGVVVRELVGVPEEKDAILGTALFMRLLGGVVCFFIATAVVTVLRPSDVMARTVVMILALSLMAQGFEVFDFWFLSRLESRLTLLATLPSVIAGSAFKAAAILMNADTITFAWIMLAETVMAGFGYLFVFHRQGGKLTDLSVSRRWAASLFRDSAPLLFAGLMVMVYTRIDQIMIGQMRGDGEVGIYAAAARIAEFWYVIPTVLLQSLYSSMIASRGENPEHYHKLIQVSFDLMTLISVAFVLAIYGFSDRLMSIIYGSAYTGGGGILLVYVWSGIFVMIGHVREYWITMERRTRLSLVTTASGAVINVICNYLLIPSYGGVGAAIATLVSLVVAGYLINAVIPVLRPLFWMQSGSLLLVPAIVRVGRDLRSRIG